MRGDPMAARPTRLKTTVQVVISSTLLDMCVGAGGLHVNGKPTPGMLLQRWCLSDLQAAVCSRRDAPSCSNLIRPSFPFLEAVIMAGWCKEALPPAASPLVAGFEGACGNVLVFLLLSGSVAGAVASGGLVPVAEGTDLRRLSSLAAAAAPSSPESESEPM